MDIYSITIIFHVISGFTALFAGLGAIIATKGGLIHNLSGKIYYYGMLGVFLTSNLLFIVEGKRLLFLVLIGILSFYFVHAGVRALRVANKPGNVRWHDFVYISGVLLAGLAMISCAFIYNIMQGDGMGILFMVFGLLVSVTTAQDLYKIYQLKYRGIKPRHSIKEHASKMGGGYIATVTAFLVTNVNFLPPLIVWIGPGVIGGVILNRVVKNIGKQRKKLAKV